jgi:hypothetical protein
MPKGEGNQTSFRETWIRQACPTMSFRRAGSATQRRTSINLDAFALSKESPFYILITSFVMKQNPAIHLINLNCLLIIIKTDDLEMSVMRKAVP